MNNKNLVYDTKSYQVLMPESEIVKTVMVRKLIDHAGDDQTPITKIKMPDEYGFFRGVEYTEENTLLEFPNNKWQKMTKIVFGKGGKEMFGDNVISKTSKLTKIDDNVKDTVVRAWEMATV